MRLNSGYEVTNFVSFSHCHKSLQQSNIGAVAKCGYDLPISDVGKVISDLLTFDSR